MTAGQWVILAAVAAAAGLGLWRAAADGRFRGTHRVHGADAAAREAASSLVAPVAQVEAAEPVEPNVLAGTEYAASLGERATLVQFSSAFCAPCRATRHTLAAVAGQVPGVVHVEIDAEHHLDLVRRLGVLRTPTTLVLDAAGREASRAAGAPRRDQVLAALASVTS
jgi:thiol-disulfide isomerase/thioredoxin